MAQDKVLGPGAAFSNDVIVNKTEINIGGNFHSFKERRQMRSHAKDMNAQYHFHNSHQTAVSLLIVFPSSKLKDNRRPLHGFD